MVLSRFSGGGVSSGGGPSMILSGYSADGNVSADTYISLGSAVVQDTTESDTQNPLPIAANFREMSIFVHFNTASVNHAMELKDDTVTVLTVVITAGLTGVFRQSDESGEIAQGSLVDYFLNWMGGSGQFGQRGTGIEVFS